MSKLQIPNRRNLLRGAAIGSGLLACGMTVAAASKSSDLYVIAEIVAKPEAADDLRALLVPFAAKSRKEPGCHEYTLMEVEAEPGRFMTFERWSGHPALDQHVKTKDMAAIGPKLGPLLSKPFTQIFLSHPKTK